MCMFIKVTADTVIITDNAIIVCITTIKYFKNEQKGAKLLK